MKFGNGFFLYGKPFFPLFLSDNTKIIVPVTYETLATCFALYLHRYICKILAKYGCKWM